MLFLAVRRALVIFFAFARKLYANIFAWRRLITIIMYSTYTRLQIKTLITSKYTAKSFYYLVILDTTRPSFAYPTGM